MDKDLERRLATLRRIAVDPVTLFALIMALAVGIIWLERDVNKHEHMMAVRCLQPDAPEVMCSDMGYPTVPFADYQLSATAKRRSNEDRK